MPKPKKWILREETRSYAEGAERIRNSLGLLPVTSKLLAIRGHDTPEKAQRFIKKESTFFHNPFLMKDMDEAVTRIMKAVYGGERITVYGDYDVDGVTSVSTLLTYLQSIGADADYYIPNRAGEGYGVNPDAVKALKARGTDLIVTVDTGITAIEETELIHSLGMDIVVTDHHRCQERLPNASAVINPQRPDDEYPFKELAGVGVVFKLISALNFVVTENKHDDLKCDAEYNALPVRERCAEFVKRGGDFLYEVCRGYIDLVAIGTGADVMVLSDENRLVCSMGLSLIEHSPRVGVNALMELASDSKNKKYAKKRKITTSYIGFTIAPRINAAGRIDDASLGVELFTSNDPEKADAIAKRLCELNVMRQTEENRIATEAIELAEKTHVFGRDPVIVLASENWHHGVIGIVSSRLTERFGIPSILISVEDGVGKGSGRSIKGLNIMETLGECKELLMRYGGHELAAGLTVSAENIDAFREMINEKARAKIDPEGVQSCIEIDCEAAENDITIGLAEELNVFEPCGVGNPQPLLLLRNAFVSSVESIGGGKHTKLTLALESGDVSALMFGLGASEADVTAGERADIVFRLDVNEFRNTKTVQLLVSDIHVCGVSESYASDTAFLKRAENGGSFNASDDLLPDRDTFASVYRAVRGRAGEDGFTVSLYRLAKICDGIRPAKLKLALEILSDVGLISLEVLPVLGASCTELYRIGVPRSTEKINLFGTPRYKNLKKNMIS